MKNKRHYSGNDKHFGPFTLSSKSTWKPFGLNLDSGGDEEASGGNNGCHLKLYNGFGRTLIIELPRLIPDFRVRHIASWNDETIERLGRNWYDEVFPCEYGIFVSEGTLHISYGPQTHDSTTTKSKCYFLPWCHWRFVRQSWYGPTGQHVETMWESKKWKDRSAQRDWRHEFEKTLVKNRFSIIDVDGEHVNASTNIEEREWRFGTGYFSWLSLFRKPKIVRTLEIKFDHEVGLDKGSWKGGLIGTSIEMLPGELHEATFRRYCALEERAKNGKYKITFNGVIDGL